MKELIHLKSVSKSYGKKEVLRDITFIIERGSFTAVIGQNGAGKSTLLRIMAGLESREGSVFYNNTDPFSFHANLAGEMFLVHETWPLNFNGSMEHFISSYREVFPNWNQGEFLRMIGDRHLDLRSRFRDLSRGQKTQFLLSMALASGAKLILCDEVTSMLDFDAQFYFLEALKTFAQTGGTVVMTTNILAELEAYADHVILLQDQHLTVSGSITALAAEFSLVSIDKNPGFCPVRPREGFRNLYLVRTAELPEELRHSVINLRPRLEDFLLFYTLKKKVTHETLVA